MLWVSTWLITFPFCAIPMNKSSKRHRDNSVFVFVSEQWRFGFIKRWMSLHGIFHVTSVHRHCICCCDLISIEICHSHMAQQHDARLYSHWHSIRDNCSFASNVNPSPFWVGMIVYKCPLMRLNQICMDFRGETMFNLMTKKIRLWGMDAQPIIEVFRPQLIYIYWRIICMHKCSKVPVRNFQVEIWR